MISDTFAQGGEIPIVGGLCPERHECICTLASGVFYDLIANVTINMGCDVRGRIGKLHALLSKWTHLMTRDLTSLIFCLDIVVIGHYLCLI